MASTVPSSVSTHVCFLFLTAPRPADSLISPCNFPPASPAAPHCLLADHLSYRSVVVVVPSVAFVVTWMSFICPILLREVVSNNSPITLDV